MNFIILLSSKKTDGMTTERCGRRLDKYLKSATDALAGLSKIEKIGIIL